MGRMKKEGTIEVKKPVSVLRIKAGAEERFKEINRAYKVLRNPKGLEKEQKCHKR